MDDVMAEPAEKTAKDPWQELSADVMAFVRENRCVDALDLGLWFYRGNAESQLAAFLRNRVKTAEYPDPE